jgi:hypothetical protein
VAYPHHFDATQESERPINNIPPMIQKNPPLLSISSSVTQAEKIQLNLLLFKGLGMVQRIQLGMIVSKRLTKTNCNPAEPPLTQGAYQDIEKPDCIS